jgi:hypothetical protein
MVTLQATCLALRRQDDSVAQSSKQTRSVQCLNLKTCNFVRRWNETGETPVRPL